MSAKHLAQCVRIEAYYRSMIVMKGATRTPAQAADAKSAPTLQPKRCVFQVLLVSVGTSRGSHFAISTDEAMLPGPSPDLHPSSTAPPLSSFMDNRNLYHADM